MSNEVKTKEKVDMDPKYIAHQRLGDGYRHHHAGYCR